MPKHPPAFQFYAADFDQATRSWSAEEVGCYLRLLLHQWINGPLPAEDDRLRRIAGVDSDHWSSAWQTISSKFKLSKSGLLNGRLEQVRQEQEEYRKRQAEAGKRGAERRWGGSDGDPNGNPISDPIGDPNGNPIAENLAGQQRRAFHGGANGDPNGDPNGQRIALLSSSLLPATEALSSPSPHPESVVDRRAIDHTRSPAFEASSGEFDSETAKPLREANPTRYVFLAWLSTLPPGSRRQLTPQRSVKIRARLKRYPLDDVVAAVRGWLDDPWEGRSENADLLYLLRSDATLEKFRDLYQRHHRRSTEAQHVGLSL